MADAFSPIDWLARFAQVGGAYALIGERLLLWIVPRGLSLRDMRDAVSLGSTLSREQRGEIVAHLRALTLVEG